ncbi:ATP-binding cassette domain-containing protein [Streptomyces sp. NBC_01187]|uniref:ATP-binding cassette domain-containing protein n=1 Tax=Streptomyces sp. NBC_01187 TaxID=2903766 RepID=UPI003864541F|nr:ATP-binding cassette domain-containing protein [Streptomyces sp. NBC_01187]
MIQAIGLTSTPRRKRLPSVDDLTFEACPGKVTVLLGPAGSGKSEALRLMLQLLPGRGVALFRGRSVHRIPHPAREIGVLLGDVPGHPARTARGHLRMLTAVAGVPLERADDVLDVVGLSGLDHHRLGDFSLGMDRRLGIAAALLGDPHTLVLDEPARGLSPREASWLNGLLRGYAEQGGLVLTTSRDPKEAARIADRVISVDGGRLVADQDAKDFAKTRLRPRVAVRTPHAERFAAVLTQEARSAERSRRGRGVVEVVCDGGSRVSVYGSNCAAVGESAYRHGILVHQLAEEIGDTGDSHRPGPLARADGRASGEVTGVRTEGLPAGMNSVRLAGSEVRGGGAVTLVEPARIDCEVEVAVETEGDHATEDESEPQPQSQPLLQPEAESEVGLRGVSVSGTAAGHVSVPAPGVPDRVDAVETDARTDAETVAGLGFSNFASSDSGPNPGPSSGGGGRGDGDGHRKGSEAVVDAETEGGGIRSEEAPGLDERLGESEQAGHRDDSEGALVPAAMGEGDGDEESRHSATSATPLAAASHVSAVSDISTASSATSVSVPSGDLTDPPSNEALEDPATSETSASPPPTPPSRPSPSPVAPNSPATPATSTPPAASAPSAPTSPAPSDIRPDGRMSAGLPPRLSAARRPGPVAPVRYELRRLFGVRTPWLVLVSALLSALAVALVVARVGGGATSEHAAGLSPAVKLLTGWPPGSPFFVPPAALAAGLLGALAFGQEFRYPALVPAHVPVPRRLGLLGAKLLVSAGTAVALCLVTAVVNGAALTLLYGMDSGALTFPAGTFDLSSLSGLLVPVGPSGSGETGLSLGAQVAVVLMLCIGCGWAGVLAAGTSRSTAAGAAAVVAVPLLVAPMVRKLLGGPGAQSLEGLPERLRSTMLVPWPSGAEQWFAVVLRIGAQPVGRALALSLTVLLCVYVLTSLRGRPRQR